jgi:dTMP kinase
LFLDTAPEQARLRGGYREERYEKEKMQARVREAVKRSGDETQASSLASNSTVPEADSDANTAGRREREKGTQWMVIDAGKERDVVSEEM